MMNHVRLTGVLRTCLAVCVLLGMTWTASPAKASTYGMEDIAKAMGILDIEGAAIATGWLDIDLDGENEPYFLTLTEIWYLDNGPEGPELLKASFTSVDGQTVPRSPIGTAILDADRDGIRDLFVLDYASRVFRVVGPGMLEMMETSIPSIPGSRLPNDAAAADLNGDGLADIVIALAGLLGDGSIQLGAKDMILMNRGGGHFDLIDLLPAKHAMTHSVTLADLDFDGRVDYMESVNFSGISGASRILFNRTEPGALEPTFEVGEYSFDKESFGMGAAVEDIDGDGFLDVYNTSAGRDYMMMGSEKGTYSDETFSRGFYHEYAAPSGFRIQWSPTFDDIDGDGLMDLFVRHGHSGSLQVTGLGAKDAESHLIYLGKPDGTFVRVPVPYDDEAAIGGLDGSLGDLNGDGLPEISMGNTLASWGRGVAELPAGVEAIPSFLLNTSDVPASSRTLTVHLTPSVSADPPVGARITGYCDDKKQVRHFTSGGKMGASIPTEVHMAWPDCNGEPQVTVEWPSGVRSEHTTKDGAQRLWAEEPEAWKLVQDEAGAWTLSLFPAISGQDEVCRKDAKDSDWQCCQVADNSCDTAYTPGLLDAWWVRVGEGAPQQLMPIRGMWTIQTVPTVPQPGKPFVVTAAWSGLPGALNPEDAWLRVGGQKVAWTHGEGPIFKATVDAPDDVESLDLAVLLTTKVVVSRSVQMGLHFDIDRMDPILSPSAYPEIMAAWDLYLTPGAGLGPDDIDIDAISVRLANKTEVKAGKWVLDLLGGIHIRVPWENVPMGQSVYIYDGDVQVLGPLPVYHEMPSEALMSVIAEARGFMLRTSVVEGGDTTRVFFTFVDALGYMLRPDVSLVDIEVDGGTLLDEPQIVQGSSGVVERRWEMTVGILADAGEGNGEVRVRLKDGRLVGSWQFDRRKRVSVGIDPEQSFLTLAHDSIPAGVGATTELRIYPINPWGEMVGTDVDIALEYPQFVRISPLEVTAGGFYVATVYADFYGGPVPIKVTMDGAHTLETTLEIVGPPPPETPVVATWPDSGDSDTSQPGTDVTEPPTTSEPSGCVTAHPGTDVLWLVLVWMLVLRELSSRRTKRRSY